MNLPCDSAQSGLHACGQRLGPRGHLDQPARTCSTPSTRAMSLRFSDVMTCHEKDDGTKWLCLRVGNMRHHQVRVWGGLLQSRGGYGPDAQQGTPCGGAVPWLPC